MRLMSDGTSDCTHFHLVIPQRKPKDFTTSLYLHFKSIAEGCWGFFFVLRNTVMKTTSLRIFIFTLRSRLDTDKRHVVRGGRIIKE